MKTHLYDKLIQYKQEDVYPFHIPGHKRKIENKIRNPYEIDITEIDGFDNLNDPQEILKESMYDAANFYKTKRTFYLVNGSTVGILSAISSVCKRGDKLLMARNCHKAVYHAVRILDLEPIYLPLFYIEEKKMFGGVQEEKLKEILKKHPDIKAVIVTSPTYEGIVINIKRLRTLIYPQNIPLIVDEAHGAHLPFCDSFPKSAIYEGADLVIQSVHKTMPAFTQTALLHVCSDTVSPEIVQEWISMYQSSSPSYLLMAGIEYAISYGIEQKEKFQQFYEYLIEYRAKINQLSNVSVLEKKGLEAYGVYDLDISKLVLFFGNTQLSGNQISEILRKEYKIEMEMSERDYVIGISTICDTKEGFERLYQALCGLDERIARESLLNEKCSNKRESEEILLSSMEQMYEMKYRPYEALQMKRKVEKLKGTRGKICGDYIYLYPPGIPILVPGERIQSYHIDLILDYKRCGFYVKGIEEQDQEYIISIIN